jgi:uncharacterized membrane protein (UPF0182 family)
MQPDLTSALAAVFGASAEGEGGGEAAGATISRAVELYRAAIEAQRAGDWAAYGRYIQELGRVLESLGATGTAGR